MRIQSLPSLVALSLYAALFLGCGVGDPASSGDGSSDIVDSNTLNSNSNANENEVKDATIDPSEDNVAVATKWDLWASGQTRLRGVDMHPCTLLVEETNVCVRALNRQDIQDVKTLGANLINASYPGILNEQPPYGTNAVNLQDLDNLVDWAAAAGMYVVINMRSGPGRNEAAIQVGLGQEPLTAVWTDQQAHDGWIDMWRTIATRYGSNPAVIGYDLMVEPHANTWLDPNGLLTPEAFEAEHRGTLGDWNTFAQEITDAIRGIDTETPIVIDSLNWANVDWFPALKPTTDPKTVYSLHAYDPDIYLEQAPGVTDITYPSVVDDGGTPISFNAEWLSANVQPAIDFAAQYNVPIYVGEFGVWRWVPDAPAFISDEIAVFESLGWNHAFYVWRGDVVGFDAFNMEYGPDSNSTAEVPGNALLNSFTAEWSRNVHFLTPAITSRPAQP